MNSCFDQSIAKIESEYVRLGHSIGWRFLTGPKDTLSTGIDIGFITLNPGGTGESPDHPPASCESGNAYLTETWGRLAPGMAPLQRQVQMLFTALKAELSDNSSLADFMDTEVMSAYFIPFRSPSIAALTRRKESLKFAIELWQGILASWLPRLIITIDNETFREIVSILSARPGARRIDARRFPTGWGEYHAVAVRLSGVREDGTVTVARLPHLSRFQLFGNPARDPQLRSFLEYLCQPLQPHRRGNLEGVMHSCKRIIDAAKFLEGNRFTQKQLSSIHHFSLKGREVTFATAYKYFGENKELKDRNLAYADRLEFIAREYKVKAGTFSELIGLALQKWPLR